jgi:hypothetical protein
VLGEQLVPAHLAWRDWVIEEFEAHWVLSLLCGGLTVLVIVRIGTDALAFELLPPSAAKQLSSHFTPPTVFPIRCDYFAKASLQFHGVAINTRLLQVFP